MRYYETPNNLKKYIGYLYDSHNREANNIIVYNREIYVFKNNILKTVFHVPKRYYSSCDKYQKKIIEERRSKNDK